MNKNEAILQRLGWRLWHPHVPMINITIHLIGTRREPTLSIWSKTLINWNILEVFRNYRHEWYMFTKSWASQQQSLELFFWAIHWYLFKFWCNISLNIFSWKVFSMRKLSKESTFTAQSTNELCSIYHGEALQIENKRYINDFGESYIKL